MWYKNNLNNERNLLCIIFLSFLIGGNSTAYATHSKSVKERLTFTDRQQQTLVTITDGKTGQPLSGVSVSVNGNMKGQTDANGQISLTTETGDIVSARYLGYQANQATVSGTTLTIQLTAEDSTLDEVVVVGYGTMRKSDVTGSISIVKGEEMTKNQNFGALDNLRGKAAGVNIFSNSGQPGAYGAKVLIRGNATINASSSPLYVVDGVVMENFHLMNPNDIERIEVLKDASSAAIYGARGANGVILVTTKRGIQGGGRSISYQGSIGTSSVQRYMNVLNSQQWVDAFMIGLENENKYQGKSWSLDKTDWFNDPNYFDSNGNPIYDTNWQKESSQNGLSHNHQINIQQGDDKSSIGGFLNYTDQQGVIKNMFSRRVSGKIAYDTKPTQWLSTNLNLMVNHSLANFTPEDGGGQDARRTMIEMLPWLPLYESNGNYTSSTSSTVNNVLGFEGMANPVSILELQKRNRYNTQIFGNAALTFHLAEGLDFRTQFGVDNQRRDYKGYSSVLLNNISKPNGWAELQYQNVFYWQQENYITYQKNIDDHRLNLMGGLSWQARTSQYAQSRTEGFDDDFYEWNNMGIGRTPSAPNSSTDKWAMNSYFLRAAYTYNNRYSATVTGRYDGSSKFGDNNKYAFFPSAGLAWNVSNEDFLSGNSTISNLKIHTSYGRTGNSEIGSYSSTANVSAGTILLDGTRNPFSWVSTLANPDLRWETSDQFDFGFELGLFENRLNFDVSVYNKKTVDLLLETPIPRTTGYSSVMKNVGSVQNRGIELLVNAYPVRTDNFSWNSTLNMSYNQNKVLKLGDKNEDIQRLWWVGGANQIIRVGENLNSFYGYKREKIYTQADVDAGEATVSQIGRPKRSTEKYIIGKGTPDWSGSFINTLNYNNFDFTLDLQFVYGVETMQQFYHSTYDRFGITNGLVEILTDAYDGTNPNTKQQAIYLTNNGHAGQDTNVDDAWVVDGSYLRFNLIQLGYTFSGDLLSKMRLGGVRVYASANNPWLITSKDFKGYDPESTSQVGDNFGQNITFFSYPRAKTFTLGLNVNF